MPTLVEEELKRRDAAAASSPSGRASYRSPVERSRDAALDYRKEHDDEVAAARDAVLQQRAASAESRAQLAADRMEQLGKNQDARLSLAEKEAAVRKKESELDQKAKELEIDRRMKQLDSTERRMKAAETYFTESAKLDPKSPDFHEKWADLSKRTIDAHDHPGVAADRAHMIKLAEANDAYNMLWAPKPPKVLPPDKTGTITQMVDGTTKIVRPLPAAGSPEERAMLEQQHAQLEAKAQSNRSKLTSKYKDEDVAALNAVKQKLGYDLIDPKDTSKTIPATKTPVVAPAAVIAPNTPVVAPSGDVVPAAQAPTAHPMEGQPVRQKSTGKMGRIVNGVFVAD